MFTKISKMKSHHQTLFAILISTAVIAFWRGLWGLLDFYVFPNNEPLSMWVSIFLGLGVLFLTHYTAHELM